MSSDVNVQVDRAAAYSKVTAPAVSLMIAAGLGMLFQVVVLVMQLLGTSINFAKLAGRSARGSEADRLAALMGGGVGVVVAIVGLLVGGLVVFGSLKMKNLESYGLAMTATILSMVPCFAPCSCSCLPLSLPLGVWALIVLLDENVKACFA